MLIHLAISHCDCLEKFIRVCWFLPSAFRLTAFACLAALTALAFGGQDMGTRSCEVRQNCALLVGPAGRCEGILDWTGSCRDGFAQGAGAVHYLDATAIYGWYRQGRLIGSFVWHRNGLLTAPGEYQTQVIFLEEDGHARGTPLTCAWDEESDRLFKRDPQERSCQAIAEAFGNHALSPDIWKTFARRMAAQRAGLVQPSPKGKAAFVFHRQGRTRLALEQAERHPPHPR